MIFFHLMKVFETIQVQIYVKFFPISHPEGPGFSSIDIIVVYISFTYFSVRSTTTIVLILKHVAFRMVSVW